jgi:DNA-binding transcriptional ArsR family regulator
MNATQGWAPPKDAAPLFAALGDATRLRLVIRLCDGGPQSIARLTTGSDFTRQAITKHLRVLEDAGVVRGVRLGRESRWEVEPARLDVARRYLDLMSKRWDERLSALAEHLEQPADIAQPRKRAKPR